jgi:hypothetical protein
VGVQPYRRVTVLGPTSTVDVALPADLTVAELGPMVVELLGERAAVPWRMDAATGAPLPSSATLAQLGIVEGELLRIGPAAPPPAPPVLDDVPGALAAAVAAEAGAPSGVSASGVLAAVAVMSVALGSLRGVAGWSWVAAGVGVVVAAALLVRVGRSGAGSARVGGGGWVGGAGVAGAGVGASGSVGGIGVGASGSVGGIGVGASGSVGGIGVGPGGSVGPADSGGRGGEVGAGGGGAGGGGAGGGRRESVARALAALPPAAAAGWLAVPGPVPAGVLAAFVAATLAAFAAQAALRTVAPAVLALLLVTTTASIGGAFSLLTGISLARVGVAAALLVVLGAPLVPKCALRLAGLTAPAPEARIHPGAELARGHLAGLVLGTAAVAACGAVLAASAGGGWGPAFAAVVCAVLALRARGFAEALPARAQQVAALLAAAGTVLVVPAPPPVRLALAAVGLGGALLLVGPTRGARSPVVRRAVDLAELGLTALAVPLAVVALELFTLVRAS